MKRKARGSYGRRSKRRRRSYRRRRFRLGRHGPLPNKLLAIQRYYDKGFSLNPGAATAATHDFSVNGLYDPDITGTGHQPRGFDQLMSLYNEYCVIKAKVSVTFTNSTVTGNRYIVGVVLRKDSSSTPDVRSCIETGNVRYATLPAGSINGSAKTVSMSVNPNKYLGISKPLSDESAHGTNSSNPAETLRFRVFAVDEGSADAPAINFSIRITYYAVFLEPTQVPIS